MARENSDENSQADSEAESSALRAAAQQRLELKGAVSRVETAAASAAASPNWRPQLIDRLEELEAALHQHAVEVEAADGLLAELTCLAPRLARSIDEIKAEHPVLSGQARAAIEDIADGAPVGTARSSVLALLLAIAEHRQRGADLVYEGYEVDLGGG